MRPVGRPLAKGARARAEAANAECMSGRRRDEAAYDAESSVADKDFL